MERRADFIADQLERRIFDGTFSDGERLDEVQLAAQFGVSRTPIREALQRLTQSGLIELIARRGAFVRQPGPGDLLDMFEVMAELEAVCARLAAERITDAALARLADANARCSRCVPEGDVDGYYRENAIFHAIIYQQSGNAFLEGECLKLHRRLQPFRRNQLRLRGRLAQAMGEHEAVLAALRDGDGEKAASALRQHVAVQGEKSRHMLANRTAAAE